MHDWVQGFTWWNWALLVLAVAIWWGGRRLATNAARRAAERRKALKESREASRDQKKAPGEHK
ncbi:MAG: hypothetical protein ABSD31_03190 [Candidatus Binataceae bacterium]|jgi:Sec-independent protein translocase protein TatA